MNIISDNIRILLLNFFCCHLGAVSASSVTTYSFPDSSSLFLMLYFGAVALNSLNPRCLPCRQRLSISHKKQLTVLRVSFSDSLSQTTWWVERVPLNVLRFFGRRFYFSLIVSSLTILTIIRSTFSFIISQNESKSPTSLPKLTNL